MSNFGFLPHEFHAVANAATKAEGHIMGDPRIACTAIEEERARRREDLEGLLV